MCHLNFSSSLATFILSQTYAGSTIQSQFKFRTFLRVYIVFILVQLFKVRPLQGNPICCYSDSPLLVIILNLLLIEINCYNNYVQSKISKKVSMTKILNCSLDELLPFVVIFLIIFINFYNLLRESTSSKTTAQSSHIN